MLVNLRDGFLFRVLNAKKVVSASPFTGSAVASRLTLHLNEAGINNGETMHSFRSGCSLNLALLGVSPDDIARHVGWRSLDTLEYYSQTEKVMNTDCVASTLAESTSASAQQHVPEASIAARKFSAKIDLGDLHRAFP